MNFELFTNGFNRLFCSPKLRVELTVRKIKTSRRSRICFGPKSQNRYKSRIWWTKFFSFLSKTFFYFWHFWHNIRLVTFRLENIFDFALLFTYRYFIYDQQLSKLRSEFWIWQRVDFVNESKFLKSDEKSAKSAKSTKPFEACKTVKTSKSRLSEFTVYNRFI